MQNAARVVPDVLDEYGAVTRAALQEYLPQQEPKRHLYDLVADYPLRGGKMMRPSLCIAAARLFGAAVEDALATAVSLELLHNALLIHDDVEDMSDERRGRPAMHVEHGVPMAVNVGDTLTLISLRPLLENRKRLGPWVSLRILEETELMARHSAEGQAMELGWRCDRTVDLTEADYLRMVLKKTCWLGTIHPLRVGALIGSNDRVDLDLFLRFGFFLGAAFQIHDDVLNLTGDGERYGKEIGGDLWEGKRTLMMIRLLERCRPEERRRIARIVGRDRAEQDAGDVAWLRELMDAYECIEDARQFAHGLAGAALCEFERVFARMPESRDKAFLEGVVMWVLERDC